VLPADHADAAMPTGGPLALSVDALRDIVTALGEADAELVADLELAEAAFEPDPFLAGELYCAGVERWLKDLWLGLAFEDPDCDRGEVE
jgi:hypothetical protein